MLVASGDTSISLTSTSPSLHLADKTATFTLGPRLILVHRIQMSCRRCKVAHYGSVAIAVSLTTSESFLQENGISAAV
jgi:hypothetical protein